MRSILTSLGAILLFLLSSLCDCVTVEANTDTLSLRAEESESESRIKLLSSQHGGTKTDRGRTVKRSGIQTVNAPGARRTIGIAKLRQMDHCAAEQRPLPDTKKTGADELNAKVVGGAIKPADKNAVVIDRDLGVCPVAAELLVSAHDGADDRPAYRISVDVVNLGGRGKVLLIVAGRDLDDHEIGSVMLTDMLEAMESKTLTTTASLTSIKSREIKYWEVFRAHKLEADRGR